MIGCEKNTFLSLNVNNFGGVKEKPRPDGGKNFVERVLSWRKNELENRIRNRDKIFEHVTKGEPSVIFLHEFDINTEVSNDFIRKMEEDYNYKICYPNGENKESFSKSFSSITVALVKNEEILSYENLNINKVYKCVDIIFRNIRIIGVHIPYDLSFWDGLIKTCKNHINRKDACPILIIGDMNVQEDPGRKRKLEELKQLGLKDIWIQNGKSNDTPTFNSGKRIDYALASQSLYSMYEINMDIGQNVREEGYTDHSSIIVDCIRKEI